MFADSFMAMVVYCLMFSVSYNTCNNDCFYLLLSKACKREDSLCNFGVYCFILWLSRLTLVKLKMITKRGLRRKYLQQKNFKRYAMYFLVCSCQFIVNKFWIKCIQGFWFFTFGLVYFIYRNFWKFTVYVKK